MIKRGSFLGWLAFCVAISSSWVTADEAPLTLAITGVEEPGLREQIITDLMQKYECCILSRSRGYHLYAEQSIDTLATLDRLAKQLGKPQAADFLVVIRTGNTPGKDEVAGEVACLDLRTPWITSTPKVMRFTGLSSNPVKSTIINIIASTVGLLPSLSPRAMSQFETNSIVVAALPFANCDELQRNRRDPTISRLHLEVEAAVQELGLSRIKLVDHNALDPILTELKLNSSQFSSPSAAGLLARLVAANRIILGAVSTRDGKLRVDVELVDAGTTAIIASQCRYVALPGDLPGAVRAAAVELITGPTRSLQGRPCSEEQRKAEAACIVTYGSAGGGVFPNQLVQLLSDNEVAFALDPHTSSTRLAVLSNLCWIVECGSSWPEIKEMGIAIQRAGDVIEDILKTEEGPINFSVQWPLVVRAEIQMMLGHYDAALQLIRKHSEKQPGQEELRSWLILAESQLGKGDLAAATHTLSTLTNKYGQTGFVWDLRGGHGDPRVQILAAKIQARAGTEEQIFFGIRQRIKDPTYNTLLIHEWKTYLKGVRKYEVPGEAADELEALIRQGRASSMGDDLACPAFVTRAMCLLDLQKNEEAVRECKTAMRLIANHPSAGNDAVFKEASNIIASIESQIGVVSETWKSLGETRPLPKNQKVYVIPLGFCDRIVLSNEIQAVSGALSAEINILPNIPISQELTVKRKIENDPSKFSTQSSTLCYEDGSLWDDTLRKIQVPSDALFVALVTSEPYKSRFFVGKPFSRNQGNPVLLSTKHLAQTLILALHYTYAMKTDWPGRDADVATALLDPVLCQYPCFFSTRPDFFNVFGVFAICPACQADYAKVDFDKIHDDLINVLKQAGAQIVAAGKVGDP